MKTKEEILDETDFDEGCLRDYSGDTHRTSQLSSIFIAMDEFGKQQAIGFAEWKDKNWKKDIAGYTHVMGTFLYPAHQDLNQLYELYLQSKEK